MASHDRIVVFALLLVLTPVSAASQIELLRTVPDDYSEALFLDPLAFAGSQPGEARLDVYTMIGYSNLSFVKEGERYRASYEVTIAVNDSVGVLVSEKSWTEEIKGLTFDASVSSSGSALHQRSFPVKPGKYSITLAVQDLDSKATKRASRQIVVPDFSASILSMSDIMLVSRVTVKGSKKSLMPNVSPNVGNLPDAFHTFTEVYNRAGRDSLRFVARVYDKKGEVKLESDTVQYLYEGRNELFMRFVHTSLPLGDYVLTIRAYPATIPADQVHGFVAGATRSLIVRWKGMPRGMKDIDLAIDQLQYIASDTDMEELKSAATLEEKQKKFLEYWKKKDPNPNTPRNEKMEEYYARVEYANRHFSHYREGWRTDMGLVFIVLGPPSNVERHPFEIDSKPYEIWSYYDLNYQYVFIDQTGFGDFRLTSPLYEVYSRKRERD